MTSLFDRFQTDPDLEEAGVWVRFAETIRVKVRRLKSRASVAARAELDKSFVNEIRRNLLTDEQAKDLALKQVAKGIIADWEGVDLGDGEVVPYTPENAYIVLKKLPEFADAIIEISASADNYRRQATADAVKNS